MFGLRVNLDDIEQMVAGIGRVALVGEEDRLHVYHEHDDEGDALTARKRLATLLKVPVQAIEFHRLDAIPVRRTASHITGRSKLRRRKA